MLVDAAKAASVKLLIWSGLPGISKLSGGKHTKSFPFDEKAEVTEYARSIGIPFVDVQAGGYMENFLYRTRPTKQADGTFAIISCAKPDLQFPQIDANDDYGVFVRKAIEQPIESGTSIYACSGLASFNDAARILSQGAARCYVTRSLILTVLELLLSDRQESRLYPAL